MHGNFPTGRKIVDEVKAGNVRYEAPVWNVVNPATLSRCLPSPREWIVHDWLPIGAVTANYGDGGLGKTLAAQLLQTSCAAGIPWLGLAVKKCRSIGLYCEDDEAEMHRRAIHACDAFNIDMTDLDDMRWISGYGQDNALAEYDGDGKMRKTPQFIQIEKLIEEHGAELVVLDTAADLFAGNENDRNQVRQFIGMLNKIAHKQKCAILLNAHPSRSGLASGNIDGGSTAWNNSVRSRWSLARPDGDDADPNERILTRRKANYSSTGDTLKLRWSGGVMVPVERPGSLTAIARRVDAEGTFLALLAATAIEGRHVSENAKSGNYAPKEFGKRADRQGLTSRDFDGAMERLFAAKKIRVEEYGRNSGRGRPRHIVAAGRS